MFDEGRENELPAYIIEPSLHPEDRRAVAAIHPSCMGGEYLPDQDQNEVEIARITIASTTQDVTCVYARRGKDRIYYRVVDEYGGDTLTGKGQRTSRQPLTLSQLADFFLGGWDLLEVLKMNFIGEPGWQHQARAFFRASSEFYPEFELLIEQRVDSWLSEHEPDADEQLIGFWTKYC
jgi:hypothetical protein